MAATVDAAEKCAITQLQATRTRVEALYAEQRAACTDDAERTTVFAAESAFAGWLDEASFGLPKMYRVTAYFRDRAYVAEKLFGAGLEAQRALSVMDALLLKFVVVRRLDVESAAARFLAFRRLVLAHGLAFTAADADVAKGLRSGAFHMVPVIEPAEDRPVVAVFPRRIEYSEYTLTQVKKAWFVAMMCAITWTPTAQTAGIVIINSLKDVGLGNVNSEFRKFMFAAVNQCLPVRVSAVYLGNEPFIFGTVLWPMFRLFVSEKIRSRMRVVGTKYERVLQELPARCVPVEMGGERPADDAELERILRLYEHEHAAQPAAATPPAAPTAVAPVTSDTNAPPAQE